MPKSRSQGCETGRAGFESFPVVLPGPLSAPHGGGVGDELAVDGVADLALESAQGFLLRLALGDAPVEVGPAVGVGLAKLADGDHVERVVELSVH